MAQVNNECINYIIKDLRYRGVILEGFQDEIIDHICSAVELEMVKGKRFIEAYHEVLKSFGNTSGLRQTQHQTLLSKNQKTKLMLRNYFTIAWRNIKRQRFYSFINIAGLAIAIAACIIIVLFIVNELSYDRYNDKAHRIYLLQNERKFGSNYEKSTSSSAPVAHALQNEYPEIESTVRFCYNTTYLVKTAEGLENIKVENAIWADSTFFKVFSVRVIEGNPHTALAQPASIAISNRIAKKIFPNISALGQMLILDNNYKVTVNAVFEDIPQTSHFHYDMLISFIGDFPISRGALSTAFFGNYNFQTYILLKENADAEALETKLPQFVEKNLGREPGRSKKNFSLKIFEAEGNKYKLTLIPLLDIHLYHYEAITYVYLFSTIAAFILIIACINFMNLSTARSFNRAREVGVRKVMGSLRSHLIRQFLCESTLLTLMAFAFGLGIAYSVMPIFNSLSTKHLELPLSNFYFYLILISSTIFVGLLSGIYPAFYLSAFRPAVVLKGQATPALKSSFVRSTLVVFQFVISISLIIGAIVVEQQLNYMQNKKLGYEKEQVILIHDGYALRPNKIQSFKEEALKINFIETGSISGYIPVSTPGVGWSDKTYWKESHEPTSENLKNFQNWGVDFEYLETFKMKIKMGRGFSREFPSDSSAIVLNERAVMELELGDDPIGKKIRSFESPKSNPKKWYAEWTVIGVIEDFHYVNLKQEIKPLALRLFNSDQFISFRFQGSHPNEVIDALEKVWKSLAPDQPFQYSFLSDEYERMYLSERRLGKIFALFATLAIIIACLGLFALTAFTAEQRTKEIGIRKVLGASVSSVVLLLSKDFSRLILIAFFISLPITWYCVSWWLENYIYKTDIGVSVYLLAGALTFIVGIVTMSYQSIKAASANPVDSLKSE